MVYANSNELYHHGIKGQRWGVRRYQNPDGTLTAAGRKRSERKVKRSERKAKRLERKAKYNRGRDIVNEKERIKSETFNNLKKNDEEYNRLSKELNRLSEKYGVDIEGGGDASRWSERDLERASERYWNYAEDFSNREMELRNTAIDYANSEILKKYGQMGIDDMRHYKKVHKAVIIGSNAVFAAGSVAVSAILGN